MSLPCTQSHNFKTAVIMRTHSARRCGKTSLFALWDSDAQNQPGAGLGVNLFLVLRGLAFFLEGPSVYLKLTVSSPAGACTFPPEPTCQFPVHQGEQFTSTKYTFPKEVTEGASSSPSAQLTWQGRWFSWALWGVTPTYLVLISYASPRAGGTRAAQSWMHIHTADFIVGLGNQSL